MKFSHCFLLACGFASQSFALQDDDLSLTLGLGDLTKPKYEGSKKYSSAVTPYISLQYQDWFNLNPYEGLNANLWSAGRLKAGAGFDYNFGRKESDNKNKLNGTGDIDAALGSKLYMMYDFKPFLFKITAEHDVINGHAGYTVMPEARFSHYFDTRYLYTSLTLSTTYGSNDYMQSYYGISAEQASNSQYSTYRANAGFKEFSISALASQHFTQHWSVVGNINYKYLTANATESPLTDTGNQLLVTLFAAYDF